MTTKTRKNSIRFAFFGTPELAARFLGHLERSGHTPSVVITAPDAPQGRGMKVSPPAVKVWAEERGIRVLQPEKLDDAFSAELDSEEFDVFIVIYYGKIIPRKVFAMPKRGTLNVHFSLLPRWKGTSPIRASILNDDKKAGISLVLMDEKIDHGPIIAQKELHIPEWPPSAKALEVQATDESAELLGRILDSWVRGEIEAREQNHDLETMCPKLEKPDGLLDLSGDAYTNLLKIQAFDSTIGTHAYFTRGEKKIRVQIVNAHLEKGTLVIDTVKPEGKKEMTYEEFLRSGARSA